jgi:hypothetical protein
VEEYLSVDVGDTLGKDVLHTFAITPPAPRIVIRFGTATMPTATLLPSAFQREVASAARISSVTTLIRRTDGSCC